MNKAKELKYKIAKIIASRQLTPTGIDSAMNELFKLFNTEFESRVNAISDEMIDNTYQLYETNGTDIVNRATRHGAKWFKEQLLKQ
jgi:hypothetical protein